jgi:Rps23 Pro-64 3,4-dihydroxylase Tpa1-like proline 4-hydroxylase
MIVNIFRKNTPNRGDLASAPLQYLSHETDVRYLDILQVLDNPKIKLILDNAEFIVIGGGGILNHDKFSDSFNFLVNTYEHKIILWGLGMNFLLKNYRATNFFRIKDIGIRDYYPKDFKWVPCASVLSPEFVELRKSKPIKKKGFLKAHADFNYNNKLKKYRTINLLLYFNSGWKKNYGGNLSFYDYTTNKLKYNFVAKNNRCLVFITNKFTVHGYKRVQVNKKRISLNYYYYTKKNYSFSQNPHKTLWR